MLQRARLIRNTGAFRVTYYPRSPELLVIVFAGAAPLPRNSDIEEFRGTLQRFDASLCFVRDLDAEWYNGAEAELMWDELRTLAKAYRKVCTIGQSMGACGALLAARLVPGVGRTLAFAPQFSILKPFINFDHRYEPVARRIEQVRHAHYAAVPDPSCCTVLFGNMDWGDYIQSSMFKAHGIDPIYVNGAAHTVAMFLKQRRGNDLLRLVAAFLDWSVSFGRAEVHRLLPDLVTTRGLSYSSCFTTQATDHNVDLLHRLAEDFAAETGELLGRNLASRRPALQSSTCPHSRHPDPALDAGGAVNGSIGLDYSFHTDLEQAPWWQVDLGTDCFIQEVRVFNFLSQADVTARSAPLDLLVSRDGQSWHLVHRRRNPAPFGGADGKPLVWRAKDRLPVRFIRVQLRSPTYLHLNQVQVFGRPFCPAG